MKTTIEPSSMGGYVAKEGHMQLKKIIPDTNESELIGEAMINLSAHTTCTKRTRIPFDL